MYRIPYARPTVTPEDICAVSAVMHSGHLATGETVERYERAELRGDWQGPARGPHFLRIEIEEGMREDT